MSGWETPITWANKRWRDKPAPAPGPTEDQSVNSLVAPTSVIVDAYCYMRDCGAPDHPGSTLDDLRALLVRQGALPTR